MENCHESRCLNCAKPFGCGRTRVEIKLHASYLQTSMAPANIKALRDNRHIAQQVNISIGTALNIVKNNMGYQKVSAC